MILIDSVYINNSGGRALLIYLTDYFSRKKIEVFHLLDKRTPKEYFDLKFIKEASSEYDRLSFYQKLPSTITKVLCFGNVPPLIRLNVPVFTYFHNILLLEPRGVGGRKNQFVRKAKKAYIKMLSGNTSHFIVQTTYMKDVMVEQLGIRPRKVLVLPIFDLNYWENSQSKVPNDPHKFLFVSNGNEHKNHLRLLEAWGIVQNRYPEASLTLTISNDYHALTNKIKKLVKEGLNVNNVGIVSREDLTLLYQKCKFLVYPSLFESFGLGLIEGAAMGQSVVASDLPFVHAVVEPYAVFDPYSIKCLAQTMLNCLDHADEAKASTIQVDNMMEDLCHLLMAED